jgi:lysophospholipase L1-like esterase
MHQIKIFFVLTLFILSQNFAMTAQSIQTHSILCLGDSYTIGESATENQRFPEQAVALLRKAKYNFSAPDIVAKTGWTTDELAEAIKQSKLKSQYDFVTLLIGVNNQYRERDLGNYRQEFAALLQTALKFAGNKKERVIIISIPDWGVTPFIAQDGKRRSAQTVGRQIDSFNSVNKSIAAEQGIFYIDITPHSRRAKKDRALIANDGLHPSGKMYNYWARKVAERIAEIL